VSHPSTLRDFALGLLDAPVASEVAAHVASCRACRTAVRQVRREAAIAIDALPPVVPGEAFRARVRQAVQEPLADRRAAAAPPRPRLSATRSLAAATAVVLLVGAGAFGVHAQRAFERADRERALVAGWLTRTDVTTFRLDPAADGRSPGSIMIADDGAVLVVLRSPPAAGSTYQVWGCDEDDATALAVGNGTVLRVDASGYREVAVSVEPKRGSPRPTAQLGRIPVRSGS
jgi:anti-sigma-K factor RskA